MSVIIYRNTSKFDKLLDVYMNETQYTICFIQDQNCLYFILPEFSPFLPSRYIQSDEYRICPECGTNSDVAILIYMEYCNVCHDYKIEGKCDCTLCNNDE